MNAVGAPSYRPAYPAALAWLGCAVLALGAPAAHAQTPRLSPSAPPVEVVDPSERISGNAAVGVAFAQGDAIGADRLWAYLSPPVAKNLKLKISSIDGRYYAEVDYTTAATQPSGWVALDLSLRSFSFVERNYADPFREVAVLLSDTDTERVYPVRWGAPHSGAVTPPSPPQDADAVRVYMNTERAQAFIVVGGTPAYCRDASAVSGFKFNAICEATLGTLRQADAAPGKRVVNGLEIYRRSGVRTLAPVTLDVAVQY